MGTTVPAYPSVICLSNDILSRSVRIYGPFASSLAASGQFSFDVFSGGESVIMNITEAQLRAVRERINVVLGEDNTAAADGAVGVSPLDVSGMSPIERITSAINLSQAARTGDVPLYLREQMQNLASDLLA